MFDLYTIRAYVENIVKKKTFLNYRIGWAFALAVLFSGLCWQLAIRVQEYLEFASDTELHEEFQSYIDFPAVSVCNYNR